MDAIGLTVLLRELEADGLVVREAADRAAARLRERGPGHAEACAYELARLYNTLEKMFERICTAAAPAPAANRFAVGFQSVAIRVDPWFSISSVPSVCSCKISPTAD